MTIDVKKPRDPLLYYLRDGDKPPRLVRASSIAAVLRYATKGLVTHRATVEEVAMLLGDGSTQIEDAMGDGE